MKGKLLTALLAIAVVAALLAVHGPSVRAQPVASITLPPPGGTEQLYPGCNNISLTFPDGTGSETVVQAVTPAGVVEAMWRHNAALNMFEGFSPAAPQASDLVTVNFLDAVWLCVGGVPAPAPPPPTAAPTVTPVPPTPVPTTPVSSLSAPPVTQQSSGVAVTVLQVAITDAKDWQWGMIEGAITVGVIDVQVSNGTARWVWVCPTVASLTISTEEAIVSPPSSALLSTEDTCADYAPGATKTGKVVFFMRYTRSTDASSMRYTFFGPLDSSTWDPVGPDYDFHIAVK